MTNAAQTCQHEWEYSDQSEPHNGIEYFACRRCETVAIATGDEIEFVPNATPENTPLLRS